MSSVSSPRSQTSSLSSDPIQVNVPEEDSASNIDVNPQSPTSASDLTNLSDISSLDAEEYDLLDDSSSESNDGGVHNQQNDTFRSRSFSSIQTQTQTQRDNRDDQDQTDADGSQSQSMDGSSSIDEDQAQSTVGSDSIRNHHHHFARNEEGSSFNSTPNQSYHPQQHTTTTAQHSPQSRSTSDSEQHSNSQLNSKVEVKSEGRDSRSSLSPTLSPYSVNQSHFSDHSMSSSNLSFPDPLGQSFLGPNSARLNQAGGVENDARSADKRREVGVQARWESQEEQNGSEKDQLVSDKVIVAAETSKKLPLSDSFTFLSDASTSPSIQTQNLSLSPTTSPKIVSDGYGCISRGGNRWREEKSTHNRHPWHVERSDKSVSSQEGGASLLDGVNSNPSQQRSRGLGLDTLGEDQDEERRTDDDEEEEGSQSNADQHQGLRDDSWSDIRHDEAASIRGDDYDDDESEHRGFCPSTNDETEFRSESGDSHVTGSGKGGNIPPALVLSGRLSKSTSTEPQGLEAIKPQIKRSTSSTLLEESLTIVHFGLNQSQSTNLNLKSNCTTSSTAITQSVLLSLAGSLDGKTGDGTVDEISRSKEEGGAEVRVFETQKKGSNSKTVVRALDFTPQDPIDVSQLRTIVEAEQGEAPVSILVVATLSNGEKASSNLSEGLKELSKVMKPQEGDQIKAQVHLLPILCPALPSNLYDGDIDGDQDSESSESNDIVQGLTRQADLQTAEKEWERVLEEASLLGIYGVNHVKPFGKVMLRLEDLLDSKSPNSEWISKLVQPSKSSSFSSSTSKVVAPQISLAASMGMVNRKSYNSSSTIKPSTASTRPPTWLSKTLTWLPTSANPISSSFSSSSNNSSGDPIKQREKERETSPTQEAVKHEAQMAAQEYLEQIDKDVAEAEKMAEQVEELDEKKGEGKIVKASNSTPTKVKSSSNVTPKKSANATLSSSPGSSRFRGSPHAKALLERSNQLRQKLAQEHQRQQNRDSWVKMDFGRISGWIQSKIPGSGEDGEQRFGLATLLTFLLFVVTSVAILFSKEIASSSVFKSGRSVISTQDSAVLHRSVFGIGQPVSGFQTKKKGNSITSLNRVESSALSLASSSKAKALALFESGSPSNSNVTISFTHCGKGTFEQSKELSTHLYDDFSALLKDGSQSASDWISGKVSQPKMVWNSSSKELISTSHVSKALSNLRDFTSKFLYHASKVANALLDSVRKEWEVYLQEMLRIWKIVMELAQDFQTFSKPYRQWIFVKSKELSIKIAENGRNLSNEIEKLEIKNQILKQVESQRAKLHHRRKQFQAQTLKTRKEILKYCEREVEDDRKEEVRLKEELYKKEIGKRISLFKSQDDDGIRRSPRLKSKSSRPSMSSSSNTGQPLNAKVLMNSDRDLFVECIKRKARKVYEDRSPLERAENAFQSAISRSVVIKGNFDRLLIKASSGGSKLKDLAKVKVEKLTTKLSFGRAKEARRVRRQNQKDLLKRVKKDRQAKKRNGRVAKALRAGGKKGKEFWK